MKYDNNVLKKYLFVIFVIHAHTIFLFSELNAAAPASHILVRAMAKYIPTLSSHLDTSSTNKINFSSYQQVSYKNTEQAIIAKKNSAQYESYSRFIQNRLDIEQKMKIFSKKFRYKTELFKQQLSEYWSLLEKKYDTYTHSKQLVDIIIGTHKIPFPTVSPDQAIINIKNITEKIFDPTDLRPLSVYITEIKNLTAYLDPEKDKQIIDCINFLEKNQHRTSILWDTAFWIQAIKERKLHEIPKKLNLKKFPKNLVISELTKKSNLEHKK